VSGPRKLYGLDGFAGLVQKMRAHSTGTEVGLYAADQAGMESDPETPWCTVCEEHNTLVCHSTLALARSHAADPAGWCEECRANLERKAAS